MILFGVVFDSTYFKTWSEHSGLKKPACLVTIKVLTTLQEFLIENGFEGILDFDRFTYYVKSNDFEPINKSFIDQFIQYLVSSNPGLSNKTIYNKISSLKSFFNFLDRVNMISHNPMAHYTNKYYERNININFLTEVECKALLKAALLEDPFSKYYYLLFWTAITTGLRNNELCCFSFEQINFQNNMVIVNKGQKTNAKGIAIPRFLTNELKHFKHYKETIEKDFSPNVFSRNNRKLSNKQLVSIVRTISEKAEIDRKVIPHDLRRTTGFLMLKSGANLRAIQQQLRHELLGTTLEYLSISDSLILDEE
ncbi:site-specific integrase [Paenibacillus sp. BR2-3]|uniref:tyrosine-type recombinase/integrase n=1 Tax=Paenibacillus sp. BR2-3 TaxID=3048494 RepID=UPI003977AFD0